MRRSGVRIPLAPPQADIRSRMSVFCMPGRVRAVPVVVLIGAAGVRGACWAGLWGRAAVCAGGRRPGREPSAPRASLGASPRSPARPRRRPRAPQPGALAPSGVLHTGGALGYRTKRVGFMVTFRLFGAEKAVLKLVVSSWGYEYPQMSGVRASDDQVWALSVRGAAMALLPVQYQPGQPH